MWLEIILLIVVAPLLEILITLVAEKINFNKRWSHCESACNKAVENATADSFVLMLNHDVRPIVLLGIIGFGLLMLLGLILNLIMYIQRQMTLVDFIATNIIYNAVFAPCLLIMIVAYSRKIFFNNGIIQVKTLFRVKKIDLENIDKVLSKKYISQNNNRILIYVKGKRFIKITHSNLNYNLADEVLAKLNVYEKISKV